jgi:uncharacterized protein YkwD
MKTKHTQKQIENDYQIAITKLHKHHLIVKIAEIALFSSLFICAASLAKAAPVTTENIENMVNAERTERGIAPLKVNQSLDNAATNKSVDMISRDYFDHYALGLTPWDFIKVQNYDYLYAGENLAMDFNTSEATVNAWMNSPAHRKNILNPDFQEMGVGVVKGEFTDSNGTHETQMVTNMFATEKPAIIKVFDNVIDRIKSVF